MKQISKIIFMKTILILFVLFFSSSVFADDISDFEIEGMSIGDSLLDYFSEEDILIQINDNSYKYKNKYVSINFYKQKKYKIYDNISFSLKLEDKKYILYGIKGELDFINNIDECFQKKDEIFSEISNLFDNYEITDNSTRPHPADKSGESIANNITLSLVSGDTVQVYCMDWSEKLTKENGWIDTLTISILNKEFGDFLDNEAFN